MPSSPTAERYRIERLLGSGGMGAVYLAHDLARERKVALKRPHREDPQELLRFKREFRALDGLVHPSLVRLYELGSDGEGLFFTMEAVDGVEVTAFCAEGDRIARVTQVLPQLVDALSFLHAHGVVHRDLKPSNALVTREGAVKVLDFGALAELSARPSGAVVVGTPGFMAPEQIRGDAPTHASDAYALGCLLFELLTGRPPLTGPAAQVLAAHLDRDPGRPSDHAASVPALLDDICVGLLRKDVRARMTLRELAALLGARSPTQELATARELIGRAREKELLDRALASGDARPIVILGGTGAGKSALARWLAQRGVERGMIVLESASRSTERLAYNALDAAMDDLAREARRAKLDIDPRTIRVAAQAFPVLSPPSAARDEARERAREALFGWREELRAISRTRIYDALAEALDAASGGSGALLVVDDFQWADDDSVTLLRYLVGATAPSLRIALVMRTDVESGPAAAWLAQEPRRMDVEVLPLGATEARAIVALAVERAGAQVSESAITEAAASCDGRPLLAEVAGRALARGSTSVLLGAVPGEVLEAHRALLALLVATDGWADAESLRRMLGGARVALDDALADLARAGVVRRSGASADAAADLYHDSVRRSALALLEPPVLARAHDTIAGDLLARGASSTPALVRHLLEAGRAAEAAPHAVSAAQAAEHQRAFSLAADMYAVALAERPTDASLREARAWALERSGRYAEAAADWATLGAAASPARGLAIALHEAHARIAANDIGEGLGRLDRALRAHGQSSVRARGWRAVTTVGSFLVGPLRRPTIGARDDTARERAERMLKIGTLLSFLDPLTGLNFMQRARSEFIRAGAREHVAGCDYLFSVIAWRGSRAPRVALAERYRDSARILSSGCELSPELAGMPDFVEGFREMRDGRWDSAQALFDRAADAFRESAGTTELSMLRCFMMAMDAHRQDIPGAMRHRDWLRRHGAECGGTFTDSYVAIVEALMLFLEGDFDALGAALREMIEGFADSQRAACVLYAQMVYIYVGDSGSARREIARALADARRYRLLDTMYAGPLALTAMIVEANALRTGDQGASARYVEKLASLIDRSPPLCDGVQWRARAYVADARGRPEEALRHLVRAEEAASRLDRGVDAAIARYQRGLRLGGDEGAELRRSAAERVRALGASERVLEEDAGYR